MRKLKQRYICAVNGREALDAYRRTPGAFFLILMDMSMVSRRRGSSLDDESVLTFVNVLQPVMDGFTAISRIRQTEKRRRLPRTMIVSLTGLTSAEARTRAFDAGVDEYRAKPGECS